MTTSGRNPLSAASAVSSSPSFSILADRSGGRGGGRGGKGDAERPRRRRPRGKGTAAEEAREEAAEAAENVLLRMEIAYDSGELNHRRPAVVEAVPGYDGDDDAPDCRGRGRTGLSSVSSDAPPPGPTVDLYNAVVSAWGGCGTRRGLSRARGVIERMTRRERDASAARADSDSDPSNVNSGGMTSGRRRSSSRRRCPGPDVATYTSYLHALGLSDLPGGSSEAERILLSLEENGRGGGAVTPAVASYNAVLRGWALRAGSGGGEPRGPSGC